MKNLTFPAILNFLFCSGFLTIIAGNPIDSTSFIKRISDEVEIKLQAIPKLDTKVEAISKSVNEMENSLNSKILISIQQQPKAVKTEEIKALESKLSNQQTQIDKLLQRISSLEGRQNDHLTEIQNLKKAKTDAEKLVTDVARLQANQVKTQRDIENWKESQTDEEVEEKFREVEVILDTLADNQLKNQRKVENIESTLKSNIDSGTTSLRNSLNSFQSTVTSLINSVTETRDKDYTRFNRLRRVVADKFTGFWTTPSNVVLYYKESHEGRTETIDFSSCPNGVGSCCKNIVDLSANAESINTNNACVILYHETDCASGTYGVYYPGGKESHTSFGSSKNKYKSVSTCY